MKWLVSGGRKFADIRFVYTSLDQVTAEYGEPVLLIHGAAKGVDSIADRWAQLNNIPRHPERVTQEEWNRMGPAAGCYRNSRMLEMNPDLCIFFPGGTGTADCYRKARAAGHKIVVFGRDSFI